MSWKTFTNMLTLPAIQAWSSWLKKRFITCGKMKLEEVRVKRNGLPVNTITNLGDLIKNEHIEDRKW